MIDQAFTAPEGAFSIELEVLPSDIDELGHVSNVVYVRWVQDVAVAHSAASGWDVSAYRALGAVFVVRRHEIDYLAPVLGGDRVKLTTWISSVQPASAERRTLVSRLSDGKVMARGNTLWVLVSTEGGRPRRIPRALVEALGPGGPGGGRSAPGAGSPEGGSGP